MLRSIDDARRDARFENDPYIARVGVRSVLAVPLRKRPSRGDPLLREQSGDGRVHARARRGVSTLSAQMAIALENSLLFEERRRVEGS